LEDRSFESHAPNSRLWSLWDIMEQLDLGHFCRIIAALQHAEDLCIERESHIGGDGQADKSELPIVCSPIQWLRVKCEKYDFRETLRQIDHASCLSLKSGMCPYPPDRRYSVLLTTIRNIRFTLIEELNARKFLWVPNDLSEYVDHEELFGPEVGRAFPSAKSDIMEAGNCLAVGCYTASVFHLMRVVEWGMRAFCDYLGFRKAKKGKKGQLVPVAYVTWDQILNQLDGYVQKKIGSYKVGPRRQETQEFCNSVTQEIRAIKDACRNHVMHTRAHYEREDVNAIMAHVKRLMVRLASRLSES